MSVPSLDRTRLERLQAPLGTATRFGMVGLLKAAMDFGVFNLVLLASGNEDPRTVLLANTLAFTLAMGVGFVLNARFTFRVEAPPGRIWRYIAVSLVGLAIYNGTLWLVIALGDVEGVLLLNAAKVVSLAGSMVWNFLGYRYLVFHADPARR